MPTREDARHWLQEAEERLAHAGRYIPGENPKILCEQAAYAAEFAIKGVLIAKGVDFDWTHDIRELLDEARDAGEKIPAELKKAKALTTYAGRGQYGPRLIRIRRKRYGGDGRPRLQARTRSPRSHRKDNRGRPRHPQAAQPELRRTGRSRRRRPCAARVRPMPQVCKPRSKGGYRRVKQASRSSQKLRTGCPNPAAPEASEPTGGSGPRGTRGCGRSCRCPARER